MYCPRCGNRLENDDGTCSCGAYIGTEGPGVTQTEKALVIPEAVQQKHPVLMIGLGVAFTAIILFFSVIPFLFDLVISVKQYSVMKGLLGSPFVGLRNYEAFFSSGIFTTLFANSIVQSLLFALFIVILSTVIGSVIMLLPPRNLISGIIVTFTLIPLFIPHAVYAQWFRTLPLPVETFLTPGIVVWFLPFMNAIKYLGIPLLTISVIGGIRANKSFLLPLEVGACFALFSLMFVTANEFFSTWFIYSPKTYRVVDSFDLYAYRSGLLQANISTGSTLAVVRQFLCLLSAAVLFMPFRLLAKRIFEFPEQEMQQHKKSYLKDALATLIAVVLFSLLACIPLLMTGRNLFSLEEWGLLLDNPMIFSQIIIYALIACFAAVINVALSIIIAYPVMRGRAIARTGSIVMILLLSIINSLPLSIGSYIFMKSIGVVNTYFAVIIGLLFPSAGVWSILAIGNLRRGNKNVRYIKAVAMPAVALVLVQIIYSMNNFIPSLLYTSKKSMLSPIMVYHQIAMGMGEMANQAAGHDVMKFWFGVLLSIIPIGILAILRIVFSDVSLLSILGMGQRK